MKKEFTQDQKEELVAGIINNVDITVYYDNRYSAQQMREIRSEIRCQNV